MTADETTAVLKTVPGGPDLLGWFAGPPEFGDAEVISLHLNRDGPSELRIVLQRQSRQIVAAFELGQWIDVNMNGFNGQNVIGGLTVRRAIQRTIKPWEKGVRYLPGEIEIEIFPCFGAHGSIRAQLLSVRLETFQKS